MCDSLIFNVIKKDTHVFVYDFCCCFAELMILGFISLFLTITQNGITKICVRESWTLHMLPCSPDEKEKKESKPSSTSHFQTFFSSNDVFTAARHLLADDGDDHPSTHEKLGYCAAKVLNMVLYFYKISIIMKILHKRFCFK